MEGEVGEERDLMTAAYTRSLHGTSSKKKGGTNILGKRRSGKDPGEDGVPTHGEDPGAQGDPKGGKGKPGLVVMAQADMGEGPIGGGSRELWRHQ